MKGLNLLAQIAVVLLIIGGLNWGFVGIFNVDLIQAIFGKGFSRLIFIVVAVAAGYLIYTIYLEYCKKSLM